MIILHFKVDGVDIDSVHSNPRWSRENVDGMDCDEELMFGPKTDPADLDDTRSSVAGLASAVWTAAGVGCIGYVIGKALEWW